MSCAQMYLITFYKKTFNKKLKLIFGHRLSGVGGQCCRYGSCIVLSLVFSRHAKLMSGDPSWYLFLWLLN